MTLYSIHIERDGVVQIPISLCSAYDLEEAKQQIREIEDDYEGWDFMAVAEDGRVFMLVDDWEEI